MDKLKHLSPANAVILVAGVVMLVASFLAFDTLGKASDNAWSRGNFLIATIPMLLGLVMAGQVALTTFAPNVHVPARLMGFTWNQIHVVLSLQATVMMLAFVVRDTGPFGKGIGLYLMFFGAVALLVGAIVRGRERRIGPV